MKPKAYRFYLRSALSPTYHNLAFYLAQQNWRRTVCKGFAHFSEAHFDFHTQAAACLEFKHTLAELVGRYCPQVMPATWVIHDQNWLDVLQALDKAGYDNPWILKPALQNNGQNIKIFETLKSVYDHYLSANRIGGEHVLQHYLSPHLLQGPQKGHKYSIRLFVVLSNYAGAYLYPHGYFNVALTPYEANNFNSLRCHLTNEHLSHETSNVAQIISTQYQSLFKKHYPNLKAIIIDVIQGLNKEYPLAFKLAKKPTLALFGFDFMVDTKNQAWLLEANHAPCFPSSPTHALQQKLYAPFWQDLIQSFILPIASGYPFSSSSNTIFEPVL